MSKEPQPQRIIISVTSGFVDAVYAYPRIEAEVEVLDMDCAKRESPEAEASMRARLTEIQETYSILLGG